MAIAFVAGQFAQGNGGTTTLVLAYPGNNTAGNFLICDFLNNSTGAATSITDTLGNTWVKAATGLATPSYIDIWYAANCAGGANTVTVHFPGTSPYSAANIAEYSGVATSSPQRGAGASNNGTSAAPSSGSMTTVAGDLVVGQAVAIAAGLTAGAGFTQRFTTGVDGFDGLEDQIAAGTTATVIYVCSSNIWACLGAVFIPAGAATTLRLLPLTGVGE